MIVCSWLLVLGVVQVDGHEWVELFDGESLSGWSGEDSHWRVEAGAIVGESTPLTPCEQTTYLIREGVTAADFELKFLYRIHGGNSGMQFRTAREGERSVRGYQADIEDGPSWTGCLYEQDGRGVLVRRGERVRIDAAGAREIIGTTGDPVALLALAPPDEWNQYHIKAQGNQIELSINGTLMCTLQDEAPGRAASGFFCMQLHAGPPMRVEFKDIRLRHDTSAAPATQSPDGPRWIWRDADGADDRRGWFRKRFTIDGEVASAELWMSCDNRGEAFVNGERALLNTSWDRPTRSDITEELQRGENWIAVSMTNEGGPAALIAELKVEYADGRKARVLSDASWRASASDAKGWTLASFDDSGWVHAQDLGPNGVAPWGRLPEAAQYTPERAIDGASVQLPEGFRCELVYSVPKEEQGSWVSMCFDAAGRLHACDQYGRIYRLTRTTEEPLVELLDIPLGEAQGMCFQDGELFVVVSGKGTYTTGLYKVVDSDGDGELDTVSPVRLFGDQGAGEHGPHAVIPGPGFEPGETGLWIIAGNHMRLPEPLDSSRVPRVWQEDQLLPRSPDARGHAVGKMAPGGWAVQTDTAGSRWVLQSIGMRNAYDLAFNKAGDLFTFDSDMEWDVGLPWYRPTRICHLTSGAEFGWRHGSGKWPVWAPDSLAGLVDLGLTSPTGVCFGYGTNFPRSYHDALFACDWAYGTIYAVHLTPEGASYSATAEPFCVGEPLPVTDTAVGPDGALWFTTGGRRTQSGVYRILYEGPISDTDHADVHFPLADLRVRLEALHSPGADGAVEAAWPHLGHADRHIRFAARTAIEHQDPATWQERALAESDPLAAAHGLIALARCGDPSLRTRLLDALDALPFATLEPDTSLAILRAYELVFTRMGTPNESSILIERLHHSHPAADPRLTRELSKLLIHLESDEAVSRALSVARTTQDRDLRLALLFMLRHAHAGWTLDLRRTWLELCADAMRGSEGEGWTVAGARTWLKQSYEAIKAPPGASYAGYLEGARADILAGMSESERFVLGDLAAGTVPAPRSSGEPAVFVHDWTRAELVALATTRSRAEDAAGLKAFTKARCSECHRFERSGGAKGPDLTGVRRRFSPLDLVETIVAPSSTISDQYTDEVFELADEERIIGRLLIDSEGVYIIEAVVPEEAVVEVDAADVLYRSPYKTSRMPEDLLDVLSEDEVRALFTLLLGPVE